MPLKVALLGLFHESNTFVPTLTTLADFSKGHWLKGDSIRNEYGNAHHEIGGMLEVMDQEKIIVVPVMFAEATPGGIISSEAYARLLKEMMDGLEAVLPVDGCLVVPHGAAVSESFSDMDGHWLSLVRHKLGEDTPIIGTLDPHANLSQLMVDSTNGLFAYKTNPHVDQRETGKEAGKMMAAILRGTFKPVQFLFNPPIVVSIEKQNTGSDPLKSLYADVEHLSKEKNLLSISILLGFPYADVREMGTSFLVISNNDSGSAFQVGRAAIQSILKRTDQFKPTFEDVGDMVSKIEKSNKPILMLDMGDNIGGGAPGNSIFLLKALEREKKCRFFICLYGPDLVRQSEEYSEGETFDLVIPDLPFQPEGYCCRVTLLKRRDGRFTETDPRHGGQVHFDMGKIAIVSTDGSGVIMVSTLRVPPFSLRQLTDFDIDIKAFDVIVAKGVNAPLAAYAQVCPTILQVNTPGVTQADLSRFVYKNRRRPLFPFEEIPPNAYEI